MDERTHSGQGGQTLVNRDKHRAVRTVVGVSDDFGIVHSEAEVVSVDASPIEMTEGAVIATAILRQKPPKPRPPGQKGPNWRQTLIATYNDLAVKMPRPKLQARYAGRSRQQTVA